MAFVASLRKQFRDVVSAIAEAEAMEPSNKARAWAAAVQQYKITYTKFLNFVEAAALQTTGDEDHILGELHAIAAEAGYRCDCKAEAEQAVERYVNRRPAPDQFLARALLIRAAISTDRCGPLYGAMGIKGRKQALREALRALEIARSDSSSERYRFLVYNCSICVWNTVQPMLRVEVAQHFLDELTQLADALDEVDDEDSSWRAQFHAAVAVAAQDASQDGEAGSRMDKALDIVKSLVAAAQEKVNEATEPMMAASKEVEDAMRLVRNMEDAIEAKEKLRARRALLGLPEDMEGDDDDDAGAPDGGGDGEAVEGEVEGGTAQMSLEEAREVVAKGEVRVASCKAVMDAEKKQLNAYSLMQHKLLLQRVHLARRNAADMKKFADSAQAELDETSQAAGGKKKGGGEGDGDGSSAADLQLVRRCEAQLQPIRSGMLEADAADDASGTRGAIQAVLSAADITLPVVHPAGTDVLSVDLMRQEREFLENLKLTAGQAEVCTDVGRVAAASGLWDMARAAAAAAEACKAAVPMFQVKSDFLRAMIMVYDAEACTSGVVANAQFADGGGGGGGGSDERGAGAAAVPRSAQLSQGGGRRTAGSRRARRIRVPPHIVKLSPDKLHAYKLSRRVEALKVLDRALLAGKRLQDEVILQEGCVIAWNLCRPLLQPHLQRHAYRILQVVCGILSEVETPLQRMRAEIHFEMARMEMAADYLAQASAQAANAMHCDYGAIDQEALEQKDKPAVFLRMRATVQIDYRLQDGPGGDGDASADGGDSGAEQQDPTAVMPDEEEPVWELEARESRDDELRELDQYIRPMRHVLELKSNVYNDPTALEDIVALMLEQVKETNDRQLKSEMVIRAGQTMWSKVVEKGESGAPKFMRSMSQQQQRTVSRSLTQTYTSKLLKPEGRLEAMENIINPERIKAFRSGDEDTDGESKAGALTDATDENRLVTAPELLLRKRTKLWSDIVQMAWKLGIGSMVQKAVLFVCAEAWHPVKYRNVCVSQVLAYFALAQSFVRELEKVDPHKIPRRGAFPAGLDPCALGVVHDSLPEEVMALKRRVLACIECAIHAAKRVAGSHYLLENAAVLVWNYHFHVFHDKIYWPLCMPELLDTARLCLTSLAELVHEDTARTEAANEKAASVSAEASGPTTAADDVVSILREMVGAPVVPADILRGGASLLEDRWIVSRLSAAVAEMELSKDKQDDGASDGAAAAVQTLDNGMQCVEVLPAKSLVELRAVIGYLQGNKALLPAGTADEEAARYGADGARLLAAAARLAVFDGRKLTEEEIVANEESGIYAREPGEDGEEDDEMAVADLEAAADGTDQPVQLSSKHMFRVPQFDLDMSEARQLIAEARNLALDAHTAWLDALRTRVRQLDDIARSTAEVDARKQGRDPPPGPMDSVEEMDADALLQQYRLFQGNDQDLQQDIELTELRVEVWARVARALLDLDECRGTQDACSRAMQLMPGGEQQAQVFVDSLAAANKRVLYKRPRTGASSRAAGDSDWEDSDDDEAMDAGGSLVGGDGPQSMVSAGSRPATSSLKAQQQAALQQALVAEQEKLPPSLWRWFSIMQRAWGASVAGMIQDDGLDKSLQDTLRRTALQHLVLASAYARRASDGGLARCAMNRAWNTALPLLGSAVTRKQVAPLLLAMLNDLLHMQDTEESFMVVRVQLYIAVAESCADEHAWGAGEKLIDGALECVSPMFQKPLWRWKVVFVSRRGGSVLDGLQKMKESDVLLQARVWATLARSSSDRKQQLSAYLQATEALGDRIERVEYLMEMAEWMGSVGLPQADVTDILNTSVDAVLGVEDADEDADADDATETQSRSTRSRPSSRGGGAGKRRSSVGGSTMLSRPSSRTGTRRPGTAASSRASSKAASAMTAAAEEEEEGHPPRLFVSHLDSIVRLLAMLSRCESEFQKRVQHSVALAQIAERILVQFVEAANGSAAMHELAAMLREQAEAQAAQDEGAAGAVAPPEIDEEAFMGSVEPKFQVPRNPVEWAVWRADDSFLETILNPHPSLVRDVIGTHSVTKPALTLHHLGAAADLLEHAGFDLLSLLPRVLARFVAQRCVTTIPEVQVSTCAVVARTLTRLGLRSEASLVLNQGEQPLGVNKTTLYGYNMEVEEIEKAATAADAERKARFGAAGGDDGLPDDGSDGGGDNDGEIEQKDGDAEAKDGENDLTGPPIPPPSNAFERRAPPRFASSNSPSYPAGVFAPSMSQCTIRAAWIGQARVALQKGERQVARELVDVARRHCVAYEDPAGYAECALVEASLLLEAGQPRSAIRVVSDARAALQKAGHSGLWGESARIVAQAYFDVRETLEAVKVLQQAWEALRRKSLMSAPLNPRVPEPPATAKTAGRGRTTTAAPGSAPSTAPGSAASGAPRVEEIGNEVDVDAAVEAALCKELTGLLVAQTAMEEYRAGNPHWATSLQRMIGAFEHGYNLLMSMVGVHPVGVRMQRRAGNALLEIWALLHVGGQEAAGDVLAHAVDHLQRAHECALALHIAVPPPTSFPGMSIACADNMTAQKDAAGASEGGDAADEDHKKGGGGGKKAKKGGAAADAVDTEAAAKPVEASMNSRTIAVSMPSGRELSALAQELATALLLQAEWSGSTRSKRRIRLEAEYAASTPIEKFLLESAPAPEQKAEDWTPSLAQQAATVASSTLQMVSQSSASSALLATIGSCVRAVIAQTGELDAFWPMLDPPGAEPAKPASSTPGKARRKVAQTDMDGSATEESGGGDAVGDDNASMVSSSSSIVAADQVAAVLQASSNQLEQTFSMLRSACLACLEKREFKAAASAAHSLLELTGISEVGQSVKWTMVMQGALAADALVQQVTASLERNDKAKYLAGLRGSAAHRKDQALNSEDEADFRLAQSTLNTLSFPWAQITVGVDVSRQLKLLPRDVIVLCLGMSAAGTALYAATGGPQGRTDEGIAKLELKQADWQRLCTMINEANELKAVAGRYVLKYGDERGPEDDVSPLDASSSAGSLQTPTDECEDFLQDLLAAMNQVFSKLLSEESSANIALQRALKAGRNVVVLVDPALQALPLEGLDVLQRSDVVCRDLSLQFLHRRSMNAMQAAGIDLSNDEAMLTALHTEGGDAIGHTVQPSAVTCIVDPLGEDENAPAEVRCSVGQLVRHYQQAGAAGEAWSAHYGGEVVPSLRVWREAMMQPKEKGSAVVFYGPGKIMAQYPPHQLVGNRLDGLSMVFINDLCHNDNSFRRQLQEDNQKNANQQFLESPEVVAGLFSVCGANTVVLRGWNVSFFTANRYFQDVFAEMGATGAPLSVCSKRFAMHTNVHEGIIPASNPEGAADDGSTTSQKSKSKASHHHHAPSEEEMEAIMERRKDRTRKLKLRVWLAHRVYGLPSSRVQL